jgi:hypothetical protein
MKREQESARCSVLPLWRCRLSIVPEKKLQGGCRNAPDEQMFFCKRAPRIAPKRLVRKGLLWSRRSDSN